MSDLIERQAAIDLINDIDLINFTAKGVIRGRLQKLPSAKPEIKCIAKVTLTDEQVKEAFEKAKDAILTAQPERKKGKWIRKHNIYGVVYCSECDYELHTNNTNFCPNCGAEMTQAGTEGDGTVD